MEMKITEAYLMSRTDIQPVYNFRQSIVYDRRLYLVFVVINGNKSIRVKRFLEDCSYNTKPSDRLNYMKLHPELVLNRDNLPKFLRRAIQIPAQVCASYIRWEKFDEDSKYKIRYTFNRANLLRLDVKEFLDIYFWRGWGEWLKEQFEK